MQQSKGIACAQCIRVCLLVLLYYPFSIALTFYQKWLLTDFKYPLSMVLCHYIIKFVGAVTIRSCWQCRDVEYRPVLLPWSEYVLRVAPIGVAAGVDICLSNWALEYITRCSIGAVIFLVSVGFVLFTYQAPNFDLLGFSLVELAALCAGLRWALSQFMMQKMDTDSLNNPVDMIYHVQPWMILCAIPMVFVFEGRELSLSAKVFRYNDVQVPLRFLGLTLTGGLIALSMELSEYLLLVNTSGITLNICGIVKEIIILVCASVFGGDQLTQINVVGLCVCLSGICLHVAMKSRQISAKQNSIHPDDLDDLNLEIMNIDSTAVNMNPKRPKRKKHATSPKPSHRTPMSVGSDSWDNESDLDTAMLLRTYAEK